MNPSILRELTERQLIPEEQAAQIVHQERTALFSLHWELKTLLYLGVLLLNAGLGWLIYLNIDEIGHGAVIATIATISAASFAFAWKHRQPFFP